MRILALRLENLASLPGPLELDFTAPPLCDAGLFAITGPTGAGKSTLLDALCLALYGSTPRLRQAPNRDSQIDDTPDSTLTTSDARTLLRRGTAAGHAEVDFLGRDGRRYRARWAVRRARHKADGRLQAAEQSLRDLDDDRLLSTQKREFDRLLPERLGLSFDQFTRAVLLAQSEFAAFLQADDNARSDLLERLTGTAEYSQISMAAFRRASEARQAVARLEARLADDLPAEPGARAALERTSDSAERELNAAQQQATRLETRQRWHDTDEQLRRNHAEGRQQQQESETQWQALASYRADREWRRLLAPQRHRLTRQAELPAEIATLETTHDQTQEALKAAESQQQQAHRDHTAAEQTLIDAETARRQAEPALREARDETQALATLEKQLTELETAQQERRQQANELAIERRQADDEQQRHRQQRETWQITLRRLMGDHERLDDARQAAQHQHDRAARRSLALSELENRWQAARRTDEDHRKLAGRLTANKRRKAQLCEQGKAARQRWDDRARHYRAVHEVIQRHRAVRSESVTTLREGLTEGEACPVCGGLDHPWRHQPPATPEAAQLAAQQAEESRQLIQAESERDEAQRQRDELVGDYRSVEATLKQHHRDLQDIERRLEAARQALADHPLHGEFAPIEDAERDAWLSTQQRESDTARQHDQTVLDELARAEAELAPLEKALQDGRLTLTRLETRRDELGKALAGLDERLPPLRQQRDERARRLAALLGEHASPDTWQRQLDAHQSSARQARDTALAGFHEAQKQQQRLAQQGQYESERLIALGQERATLDREMADWRRAHPELDDATLARLLAQPDDEARRQEQAVNDAEQARQQADATLAERRQALLAHRRDQALTGDETNDDTLLSDIVQDEIRQRHEALTGEGEALAPRLDTAQRHRDEALHALHDDDRRRTRQQECQAELEAARAEYRRWGQISELIGSADGKTFRRIAQAYNLEQLLEHANTHLAGLSRRYRLARGGSPLGLLVVDVDMGDERRSVHSLSGGETFLVSLALALGLASMASGDLMIESLFIDEGFGSLDPQSLALAMEALDGLQALGRRVGVISHVQEMHERIPVQIQVEPLGNGTSKAMLVSL
ncbi:AAA family ATPase [Halomonas sp. TRM85114]|uniref:AAA family ATPase n=1 Tax=Halomonas jincaotanensis TaxID=2810616 RepID=UPI001BD695B0|nr:AAA family ATPase [Halomonas jincaotanensis]MBS9404573.1 AAA family ATPase [Halomonas jincaotanensis]